MAVDIGKVLSDVNSLIRNTTLNLANVGFREFMELAMSQTVPLQSIFVASQINHSYLLSLSSDPAKLTNLLNQHISLILNQYAGRSTPHQQHTKDIILISLL